jgi:hypothetical protein
MAPINFWKPLAAVLVVLAILAAYGLGTLFAQLLQVL